MSKMEKNFDPNIPDTSHGSFFCRLCHTEVNSESTWAVHVAGRRHYRNLLKYPNGVALRQNNDDDQDSYEKPAKYRRYEKEDWKGCPPKDYGNELYTRRNFRPEIIDYDHKKGLSVVSSPVLKASDGNCGKEKYENPIDQIFVDKKFDQLKKSFEENISKAKTGRIEQNTCNSNKVKPQIKKSEYEDDFEKELDELLKKSSYDPESEKEDTFSKDKLKRKIDDLFGNKLSKRDTKDKDLKLPSTVDCKMESNKKSNSTKIPENSTLLKKSDDKDKKKIDQDSFKKKNKKNNDEEEDFVDIFHKMNDEKLFEMSAADEDEDISSVKESSKTKDLKLDFDPDKLTTDCVDNLLNSYLKPKSDSSKSKESPKSSAKISSETNHKDDLETFSRKLESLPTKAFFQIILTRLKNLDLKDSEELKMLLGVISQAQEVVCNKLPPHLQAVIKSKMSQNNSKPTPGSIQHPPVLPQTESVETTPIVSQTVSKRDLPTTSGAPLKSAPKFLSQKEVKSASLPVSSITSQSVQTAVSNTTSLIKPPSLSSSDSLQNMIAWQKYLTSVETASEKQALKSSNSVQSTIAYQNYLSSLQAKALIASKMLPKTMSQNTESLNTCSNSKTSLSSSPSCKPSTSQTVAAEKLSSTSNSVNSKDAVKNIFSLLQSAASKTVPQTPSSSSTKSASASDSSQSKSTSKYVSKKDAQTVSSTAEIPSNTPSYPNQAVLQNYQAYYQQMYAMHLQRMSGPYANIGSSQSAFLAALSQSLAASQRNSSLPSNSHSNTK